MKEQEASLIESQLVSQEGININQYEGSQVKQDATLVHDLQGFKNDHHELDEDDQLQLKVNEFLQSKLQYSQFKTDENHDQFCVCPDCACERSVNRPSHTLFNLTMRSVYKRDFKQDHSSKKDQKSTIKKLERSFHSTFNSKDINENSSIFHPKNTVTLQTIYDVQMGKSTHLQPRKPLKNQDLLKFNGPLSAMTTYKQKFPGISGGNPYVRPVDKAIRQNFSLNPKTMNQTLYKGEFTPRSDLRKSPDNMRTGLPMLFKQSTSQKFYSKPLNPERYNTHSPLVKRQYVLNQSLKDRHQFDSVYKSTFKADTKVELARKKIRLVKDTMAKLGMLGY